MDRTRRNECVEAAAATLHNESGCIFSACSRRSRLQHVAWFDATRCKEQVRTHDGWAWWQKLGRKLRNESSLLGLAVPNRNPESPAVAKCCPVESGSVATVSAAGVCIGRYVGLEWWIFHLFAVFPLLRTSHSSLSSPAPFITLFVSGSCAEHLNRSSSIRWDLPRKLLDSFT